METAREKSTVPVKFPPNPTRENKNVGVKKILVENPDFRMKILSIPPVKKNLPVKINQIVPVKILDYP